MSFLLKSPRLARSLVGIPRQAEFVLRKIKILPSIRQPHFKVSRNFVRSYSSAPQIVASEAKSQNSKETLYQKSISQIYTDIKLKGYTKKEDVKDAWHLLEPTTPYTMAQTVVLIGSCGHSLPLEKPSEKLKLVKEIWDSFDDIGVKKTIYHYNALLNVYNELEHNFCPQQFLNDLKQKGLTPNLETYKKLIHALSIQGNITDSQDFLEQMKMNSVTIDDGVFNTLILGYSLKGDFISAHGILELMKEKGLVLSSDSFVNLALGYAKMGDIDKVKETIEECKKNNLRLSTTMLLEIAYTSAVNKHLENFSAILDMITLAKNFPTVSTKVVHRLLHKNLDKEAFMLFELRYKLDSFSKSQETLQMFLDHYIRFRKPLEVLKIVHAYEEKGWTPIALAYSLKETLIHMDVSHCLNFLETLKSQGHELRIHYFYPILIKTHQNGNEEVLKILEKITKYRVPFNLETVKAFHWFYDFLPGAELKDLEKIKRAGVKEKLISWKILNILLFRKNIDDAIKLVSTYNIAYSAVLLPGLLAAAFSTEGADPKKFVYILLHLIRNIRNNKIERLNRNIDPYEYEQFFIELGKACDQTFTLRVLQAMLNNEIPIPVNVGTFIRNKFPCEEIHDVISKLTSPDMISKFHENVRKEGFLVIEEPDEQNEDNDLSKLEKAIKSGKNVGIVMDIFEKLAQKADEYFADPEDERIRNIMRELYLYVSLKKNVASTERIYEFGVEKKFFKENYYAPCVKAHLLSGKLNDAVARFYKGLKETNEARGLKELIREIKKNNNDMAFNDLKVAINSVLGEHLGTLELLKTFVKLGNIEEIMTILQSETTTSKQMFNALFGEMFTKKTADCLEAIERAARRIPGINSIPMYSQLLKAYALNGNLEKILELYVELECDECMEEDVQKIFFFHLKNWRHDIPEKLKNVFQCILEDCRARLSVNTETVSCEENIQEVSVEEIQPGPDAEIKSNPDTSDIDFFECYCLIQNKNIDKYFKILREKIKSNSPKKAKYFFPYKLAPHLKKNPKYLEEYEKLVTLGKSPTLWKTYLKLCLRLQNIPEVQKAMKKLQPKELENCFREISFNDCLYVVNSSDFHKILKKNIVHFYKSVINTCLKENKFDMARKYFEKAKKNNLEIC